MKGETDPDIRGSWPAMLRAAKKARKLAEEMGTPFYVVREGRIVDLNAKRNRQKRRLRA